MLLVLQIAQYEAVALEVKKLLLVLFWTVFRIMRPGVITNPEIKVCNLTKPGHSQEMLWKSHSTGSLDPKSDPWALQIHPPD